VEKAHRADYGFCSLQKENKSQNQHQGGGLTAGSFVSQSAQIT
jgi:hypothetical protein